MKISVTLVLVAFIITLASIAASSSVQAYPSDALFAQQINQTSGAIINYRQPSEIQKFINDDPTDLEQVLHQLIWQIYKTSGQDQTLQVVNEITRQVLANPEGFTGDSIFWFGYQVASGHANKVTQLMGQVTPPPTASRSVESFTNISMDDATLSEDAAQTFFHGVGAVISGNTPPAGFTQSSYTSDICNNLRIVNISEEEIDGQFFSAEPLDIVVAGSPTDLIKSGIHHGIVINSPVCNLNSNHDVSYHLVRTIPNRSLLADAIRQVFGQIILETALEGGQTSAQQALINIVDTVNSNPSGSLSKAIFLIASVEASGNITAANSAVKAIADNLACAGDVMKIPGLVDRILSPTRSSAPSSICPIAGPVVPKPPNPKPHALSVAITLKYSTMPPGPTQNIGVTVSDDMNKSKKISGANVNVDIQGPGFKRTFSRVTDNTGAIDPPFQLQISGNAIPGSYKVTADAVTMGYNKGSATTTFTVACPTRSSPICPPRVAIIVANESQGLPVANSAHCDKPGYPSCYSIGYEAGKKSPGTSCPSGHTQNYCAGWNSGARNGTIRFNVTHKNLINSMNPIDGTTAGHHHESKQSGGGNMGSSNNNNGVR